MSDLQASSHVSRVILVELRDAHLVKDIKILPERVTTLGDGAIVRHFGLRHISRDGRERQSLYEMTMHVQSDIPYLCGG